MHAFLLLAALIAAPDTQSCDDPIDQVVSSAVANGGTFLGTMDVPGDGFDQIVGFVKRGRIVVGLAWHGCIVTPPIQIGPATPDVPA